MSIWLGNQRLDSGIAHNIGDIFYTTRNDTSLNGAVECNGGTYSTADYEGQGSIGELLRAGKLSYISLSAYASAISSKGWCDKIGWDGGTTVRVPKLTPHIIQKNNLPVKGNGMAVGLTNGTNNFGLNGESGSNQLFLSAHTGNYGGRVGDAYSGSQVNTKNFGITTDGTKSGIIADTSDTAQLRVMFQLFNSTTDEAVATVGTVVAQVGELNSHRVVDFQMPTADNGYTWYRKYADGWVEQGGTINAGDAKVTITFPVAFSLTPQVFIGRLTESSFPSDTVNKRFVGISEVGTTSFSAWGKYANNNSYWFATGISA